VGARGDPEGEYYLISAFYPLGYSTGVPAVLHQYIKTTPGLSQDQISIELLHYSNEQNFRHG
jgi:hypothetical protein